MLNSVRWPRSICILVDDLDKSCERFERLSVKFNKKPNEGRYSCTAHTHCTALYCHPATLLVSDVLITIARYVLCSLDAGVIKNERSKRYTAQLTHKRAVGGVLHAPTHCSIRFFCT